MKISFTQSGGFAGLTKIFQADVEMLPANEANELSRLIEKSGFFSVDVANVVSYPDAFQYDIAIEGPLGKKAATLRDGKVPKSFKPLVAWLSGHARYEQN